MEYIVGVVLALSISSLATVVGLDRDRAFYPTLTIVIASYYGLFAVIGGSLHALILESVGIVAFLLLSLIGFRFTLWCVVAALAAHGVFDWFHGRSNRGPWRSLMVADVLSGVRRRGSGVSVVPSGLLKGCRQIEPRDAAGEGLFSSHQALCAGGVSGSRRVPWQGQFPGQL